jgi:predicted  nucleic acid-binding Zn-ribbon protein
LAVKPFPDVIGFFGWKFFSSVQATCGLVSGLRLACRVESRTFGVSRWVGRGLSWRRDLTHHQSEWNVRVVCQVAFVRGAKGYDDGQQRSVQHQAGSGGQKNSRCPASVMLHPGNPLIVRPAHVGQFSANNPAGNVFPDQAALGRWRTSPSLISYLTMARIEFQDSAGLPQRFEIPEDTTGVVIGRSPSCDCVIANHSVGRNHARIGFDSGSLVYVDLGSVNGSFLSDQKITGSVRLSDGDVVMLGEVAVRFMLGVGDSAADLATPAGDVVLKLPQSESPAVPDPDVVSTGRLVAASMPIEPPLQVECVQPVADEALSSKVDVLAASLAQRDEEVRHLQGLIADGERRVRDAESRATLATSGMESMHSKYLDMRDQVSHIQSLLEAARAESSERDAEAAELRGRVSSLGAQVDTVRGRTGQTAEEIGNLKVKLTERDREIDRLRRELDASEYDLKALREENERLEQYCQSDTGRQQELERKVSNLDAVIDENRNLIAAMRRNLEEKDRDLRQVRMGVGIADLEHEKRRLLDDYHKKSSELDDMRATLADAQAESASLANQRDELLGRVRVLEEDAKVRRSERVDILDHPDYLARSSEVEILTSTVGSIARQVEALDVMADGLVVLQAVLKDAGDVLTALDGVELPASVMGAFGGSSPRDLADSVRDVRQITAEDIDVLRAALAAIRLAGRPRS